MSAHARPATRGSPLASGKAAPARWHASSLSPRAGSKPQARRRNKLGFYTRLPKGCASRHARDAAGALVACFLFSISG
ncbi:hypothetical protein CALVIDRAFT_533923 [Calocera viscosa TUFC12733]|uniref:Uncharacterized protein n=1 Tax=Calocera viscosa (strain TUFC12733) TaxID=1330018 RepID=A0A167QVB9_CALVF|nr:hypothetical protein CALVIDRAFT_533923 [Calocera viscosa TUFC12733]